MKKFLLPFAAIVLVAAPSRADKPVQKGAVIAETSVACGSKSKGKKTTEILCQQYIVRTDTTDYQIRQEKPSDKALIPVNTAIEFTLDKDKIKFKANGKSYEYVVVSEAAAGTSNPDATAHR